MLRLRWALALGAISGLFTGLGFNFSQLSFLVWFSLIPFIIIISQARRGQGALAAFLFGFFYYLTVIFWVGKVSRLGLIILVSYLSFYYVFIFLAGRYFLKKPFPWLSLPACWVLAEFLKDNIWCGFSWGNLGYTQYLNTYFIQPAGLLGVKFFSFLIVMVNMLFWEALFIRNKKYFLRRVILVLALLSGCFVYSFWKINSRPRADSLPVSIIQPNVPQKMKANPQLAPEIKERLKGLSLQAPLMSLVVFPEAAWPFSWDEDNIISLKKFVREIERDTVMGKVTLSEGLFSNQALFLDREGTVLDAYSKVKLVPYGEYIPLRRFLSFISVINTIGDMSQGKELTRFSYKDTVFSLLICFEDVSSHYVVEMARGRDFLINITDDSWFGGEPEASQHLAIMALRAIENNISIVRSANTGISGWVSNTGRIAKMAKADKEVSFQGVEAFDISLNRQRSLYNRYPQILVIFCAVWLLGVTLIKKENML